MRRVGSREFKNRLGKYLRAVRAGQTLIITDRGRAVARVGPTTIDESEASFVEERLKELEAKGFIHLGKKAFSKFRPIKSKGKPASQIIIEERR
jgi:prevent-host-death family protein